MEVIRKVLKWIGISIGALLLLIILAGLCLRLTGTSSQPPGKLVDIGDFKLHINAAGEKSIKPTLVIEAGNGLATECYHWLNEGLKVSMRVVRYDRAGIGFSDASNTPREAETIAHELHALLENAGESPPYILVGHSLGGPFIRVFAQLYPKEVAAMLLMDTTHPEQVERRNLPLKSDWRFTSMIWMYDVQSVLGDMGIMMLYDKLFGPILQREMEGLPDYINQRSQGFLWDGKYIRAIGKEFNQYHTILERASKTIDFGSLPIRIFTAAGEPSEEDYKEYLKRGMDLKERRVEKIKMQKEFLDLSTNSKQILIDGNHTTIFTRKENADIICKEVIQLLQELEH